MTDSDWNKIESEKNIQINKYCKKFVRTKKRILNIVHNFMFSPRYYEKRLTASFCHQYLPVRKHFDGKYLVVYFF